MHVLLVNLNRSGNFRGAQAVLERADRLKNGNGLVAARPGHPQIIPQPDCFKSCRNFFMRVLYGSQQPQRVLGQLQQQP